MKPSCLDCPEFSGCQTVSKAWKKAWTLYPDKTDADAENRRKAIEIQYQICHEKQSTIDKFRRRERAIS